MIKKKINKLYYMFFILIVILSINYIKSPQTQAQTQQGIVAVVDTRRAVSECARGKKAQLDLRKKFEKLQSEINSLGQEVENLRKDLENSAILLKPEAKLIKEREFERKAKLFNDRRRDAQQELSEAERDALTPIIRDMQKIIQEIGSKANYTAILEAASTLYYPKTADVTSQVIVTFDKIYP